MVNAHSKWPEVVSMTSTTAQHTIEALRSVFSHYGFPEQLVSDNGPQFTSDEFACYMKETRVKHILCSPYTIHPLMASQNDSYRPSNEQCELEKKMDCHSVNVWPSSCSATVLQRMLLPTRRPVSCFCNGSCTPGSIYSSRTSRESWKPAKPLRRNITITTPCLGPCLLDLLSWSETFGILTSGSLIRLQGN